MLTTFSPLRASKFPIRTPLKHPRYADDMTLCIAAHANLHGYPRIILCFDSLVGDEFGTSESLFKCDLQFAPGLTAMFAGTLEDAEDAVRLYKERLGSSQK